MEPQEIFREVMKAKELQSYFNISEEEAAAATYIGDSKHTPIEIIKDVINSIANRRTVPATFQGILKKVSD
ncbi:hypothetical protein [Phocaeicola sartorii]|uniref:hypothetical protein n=1 Tax=Phocaeicola sartorii TaxID=671267 RepID=UPI00259A6E6C|nr:hypothetical protein [Phocaeicola sartorii]